MKRKVISLIVSLILTSSLAVNVKATDVMVSGGQNPSAITNEDKSSETNEKTTDLDLDSLQLQDQFKLFIGDDFKKENLIKELSLDESYLVTIISPIEEGRVTDEQAGTYMITIKIEDDLGNVRDHAVNVVISGKPEISLENNVVSQDDIFSLDLLSPKAFDYEDGDLSQKIVLISSEVDLGEKLSSIDATSFNVVLSVTDSDDNNSILESTVEINEPMDTIMMMQSLSSDKTMTIAGNNRYETAVAISQQMYGTTNTAILVSSENFPDALSAGPLSVLMGAPILLSAKDGLPLATEKELEKLKVQNVIIMGGPVAISMKVENALVKKGIKVERISGDDRYTTAIAAAKKLGQSSKIFLANGANFADALSAGSYASKNGHPIILTENNKLTPSTREYLKSTSAEIIIVGGEIAVSAETEKQIRATGKTVSRIAGGNRFTTAVEMSKKYYSTSTVSVVANGWDFVDALTAVPYAASMNAPILLTNKDSVDAGVTDYIVESKISNYHFVGGEVVISKNVKNNMMYPSLYEVTYRTGNLNGVWSKLVNNGQTSGDLSSNPISLFDIKAKGNKDISIRYGVSVVGSGWQSIVDTGEVGQKGKGINGMVMELRGNDALKLDISYRAYIKDLGWTEWTLGGKPVGSSDGNPILAVESRIIKGDSAKVNRYLFPSSPSQKTYYYTKSNLNLRKEESSSSSILFSMPTGSQLDILSINPKTNWGKVNFNAKGITHVGYASMAYITQEKLTSKAILTVNGLNNLDKIPTSDITVNGIVAYSKGISVVNYYINGEYSGRLDYGILTDEGIKHGFKNPEENGYKLTIPSKVWDKNKINTLKIEIVGNDGVREWETKYIKPNTKETLVLESNGASFNYYMNTQLSRGDAHYDHSKPTAEVLSKYMDPSKWITHDTYKYMFLDLGYSATDYTVTSKQLDDILNGKGVLHGTGSTFLQAAKDFNINPFYLIAHAIHETGNGTSVLAQGQQLKEYHEVARKMDSKLIPLSLEDQEKKWFNVYGIDAIDGQANLWGGEKAYREGWDTVEKAIYGGAKWIGNGYIVRSPRPQNTIYKMRFNLNETMRHQYATDIMWSYKQAPNIKKQFDAMGVDVPLRFIVPVFNDIRP